MRSNFPVPVLLIGFLFLWAAPAALAQSSLPPQVQLDLLETKLVSAMKGKRYKDVLSIMNQMRKLGTDVSGDLAYFEALAYAETKNWPKAAATLEAFLKTATRGSDLYNEALQLYAKVDDALTAKKQEKAEEQARLAQMSPAQRILLRLEKRYPFAQTTINVSFDTEGREGRNKYSQSNTLEVADCNVSLEIKHVRLRYEKDGERKAKREKKESGSAQIRFVTFKLDSEREDWLPASVGQTWISANFHWIAESENIYYYKDDHTKYYDDDEAKGGTVFLISTDIADLEKKFAAHFLHCALKEELEEDEKYRIEEAASLLNIDVSEFQ